MMTSAGNLEWLQSIFDKRSPMTRLSSKRWIDAPSNLVYLPYLQGERAPFNDPFARGAFIGISAQTARADLCRSVARRHDLRLPPHTNSAIAAISRHAHADRRRRSKLST